MKGVKEQSSGFDISAGFSLHFHGIARMKETVRKSTAGKIPRESFGAKVVRKSTTPVVDFEGGEK
jgi:hypothetical protein